MTYEETSVTHTIDRLTSEQPGLDASTTGALDNLDQFHIGGADAVDLLIPTLALAEADVVLDVGSGFGGPARQLARRTGNRVLGIDITPAYVDAARDLTEKAMLADLVHFETSDIAALPTDRPFQAAITMHVQMNVEDKAGWFEQIGRRLEPGSRLAIWEVCGTADHDLGWPMPWSWTELTVTSSTPHRCTPPSNAPDSAPSNGHSSPRGSRPGSPRPWPVGCPMGRPCRCFSTTATPGSSTSPPH